MAITFRSFWTAIHGLGFGALYLLACSGALVELRRLATPSSTSATAPPSSRFLTAYLLVMTALAWLTVLSGTYVIYPWYRAVPPPGTTSLAGFPQRLLLSSPATSGWHSLGMEWKEHVAWFVPIAITAVTAVILRYGPDLRHHRPLRSAVLSFAAASFLAAGVAGFFGAMINKAAPLDGGPAVHSTPGALR